MEVKGVSVRSVREYIEKNFPGKYAEWIESLPDPSKKIYKDFIRVNEWYPISAGLAIPLKAVGNIFYNGNWKDAVWKMGRFSADEALSGIYKIYVKLGSPRHIIDRAGRVMSAYFSNSEIKVTSDVKNQLTMQILRFDEPDEAIEYNIAGWIERALEISGCKNINLSVRKSLARKDAMTEYYVMWE
jgi:antitoxin component YwqK of YwqJK toxin-antitoxin module